MNSAKCILIRECILNSFRRKAANGARTSGELDATIAEIWSEQADATKRKFSERDFLAVIGDLVAIGTLKRYASHLEIPSSAPEISQPDYRAFCKGVTGAVVGADANDNGRFAVLGYGRNTSYLWVHLFPTRIECSASAKEDSNLYYGECFCLDLLDARLGPGCEVTPLFFEIWKNGELTRSDNASVAVCGGAR